MGNTEPFKYKEQFDEDHPHIHGEYLSGVKRTKDRSGSPPTYMGNTQVYYIMFERLQDHPHIHGEHPKVHT